MSLFLFSCSDDDSGVIADANEPEEEANGRYIIMSSERAVGGDVAYMSVYDALPTGEIENASTGTTQVNSYGRFNTYKDKWAFKKKKFTGETGIVRYSMNESGTLDLDGFISTETSPNYAILDDTHGYYYDSADGDRTIGTFNPTTMARTGELTIADEIFGNELDIYEIAVGTKTMIISKEKLFVNVEYAVIEDDGVAPEGVYIPKFTMLIINTETNEVEKKIRHTAAIFDQGHGSTTEFSASLVDEDGDIYMSTHALFAGRNTYLDPSYGSPRACVFKIEYDDLDFDQDWVLKGADIQGGASSDNYVVWSMALDSDGTLYVNCSKDVILDDFSNLLSNIYYPYIIDKQTRAATIIDAPATNFGHADGNLYSMNGEVYYQFKDPDNAKGGYYLLNSDGTAAEEVFSVTDTYPRALGYLEIQ
ncbi:hypothetical protein APS56_12005 [Pseudalgibacter alginicilyticus]|uniref:DUF4374 domain-containing protein n=2 Tax=Pseudalgibacter alginicilyticus TaxID=1736674 RepID=A0A0P0CMT4_9FLAO|nr:hypothetical protein APS56_12005 [Pseudalgibacter alginicilyticus]